ncbi:MAG: zinc metallopeptidase [Chloroflexi bacterium]|nr:zinc metallopeptidase [Chloroflexota bacterium]MCL5108497.1 zinc metallopeptidase [Chloroflexota bacterium]
MFFFDPLYFLFALPALLAMCYAQWRVRSAYGKYSQVRNTRNATGAEVARVLLQSSGLHDVQIGVSQGQLTDHYNPWDKSLNLSPDVYQRPSVAAMGIVAHEVGHAVQDAQGYALMRVRGALAMPANLGSNLGVWLAVIGVLVQSSGVAWLGILLFSAAVLFTLVTLPVELDASNRALAMLTNTGLVTVEERNGAKSVLQAASLTYVAALLQSVMTLLYFVIRLGGLGRDE